MSDIEDQIQAEVDARLKEAGILKNKPASDQTQQPVSRTRPPAPLPDASSENQANQQNSEQTQSENPPTQKSASQVMQEYLDSKNKNAQPQSQPDKKEDWKSDAIHGAEAVGASEVLRKLMPDYVPYPPQVKVAEQENILENDRAQKAEDILAKKKLNTDFESHIDYGNQLKSHFDNIQDLHQAMENEHQRALLNHEYHKTLTINDYLPEELRYDINPLTSGEKWSNKTGFGVGAGDVNEVSQRYKNMMPKGEISKNYAQTLGGTQAMRDAKADAKAQADALEQERAKYLPQAQEQLARDKAMALKQAEDAKKARDATFKQLVEASQQLNEHRGTPAPTTVELTEDQAKRRLQNELQKQEYEKRYGKGPLAPIFSAIPGSESRVVTPAISGALSETWAEKAKKAWESQPDWQHAIMDPDVAKYGSAALGSILSMVPNAPVRGAGVLMQAPAALGEATNASKPFWSPLVEAYEKHRRENP
jgi:hypothetical protein